MAGARRGSCAGWSGRARPVLGWSPESAGLHPEAPAAGKDGAPRLSPRRSGGAAALGAHDGALVAVPEALPGARPGSPTSRIPGAPGAKSPNPSPGGRRTPGGAAAGYAAAHGRAGSAAGAAATAAKAAPPPSAAARNASAPGGRAAPQQQAGAGGRAASQAGRGGGYTPAGPGSRRGSAAGGRPGYAAPTAASRAASAAGRKPSAAGAGSAGAGAATPPRASPEPRSPSRGGSPHHMGSTSTAGRARIIHTTFALAGQQPRGATEQGQHDAGGLARASSLDAADDGASAPPSPTAGALHRRTASLPCRQGEASLETEADLDAALAAAAAEMGLELDAEPLTAPPRAPAPAAAAPLASEASGASSALGGSSAVPTPRSIAETAYTFTSGLTGATGGGVTGYTSSSCSSDDGTAAVTPAPPAPQPASPAAGPRSPRGGALAAPPLYAAGAAAGGAAPRPAPAPAAGRGRGAALERTSDGGGAALEGTYALGGKLPALAEDLAEKDAGSAGGGGWGGLFGGGGIGGQRAQPGGGGAADGGAADGGKGEAEEFTVERSGPPGAARSAACSAILGAAPRAAPPPRVHAAADSRRRAPPATAPAPPRPTRAAAPAEARMKRGSFSASTSSGDGSRRSSASGARRRCSGGSSAGGKACALRASDAGASSRSAKRWLCVMLPMLALMGAAGAVTALYFTQRLPLPGGGAPAPVAAPFSVTVAAPARSAHESCGAWFGSSERVAAYSRLFGGAYAGTLDLPPSSAVVTSVTCGGSSVFAAARGGSVRALRAPRAPIMRTLLAAPSGGADAAAAAAAGDAPLTWVDITTAFTIAAPPSDAARVAEAVSSASSGILAGPLSQFLGVNTLLVKAAAALGGAPPRGGAVAWGGSEPALAPARAEAGSWAAQLDPAHAGEELPVIGHADDDVTPGDEPGAVPPSSLPAAAAAPRGGGVALPPAPPGDVSAGPSERELSAFPWNQLLTDEHDAAPTCLFSPTRRNGVTDAQGRLWSLMNGRGCVFRAPAAAQQVAPASGMAWATAPGCAGAPTVESAMLDTRGNLWGWEDARSCAFRGRAPTTLGGKPSTFATLWEDAAPCEAAPTQGNADADAFGRLWGKQGGVDCAFKFVGRVAAYSRLFGGAYAGTLDLPPSSAVVTSVTCGGSSVFAAARGGSVRALRAPRAPIMRTLLAAPSGGADAAAAAAAGDAPLTWVDITTAFTIAAPPSDAARVAEAVSSASSGILAGPLSQFLGVNTLLVKAAAALGGAPPRGGAVAWGGSEPALAPARAEAGSWAAQLDPAHAGEELPVIGHADDDVTPGDEPGAVPPSSLPAAAAAPRGGGVALPPAPPGDVSAGPSERELSAFPWNQLLTDEHDAAPTCLFSPTRRNGVTDAQGRLWSLMNGRGCVFRAPAAAQQVAPASGMAWATAPGCAGAPTVESAMLDTRGNLWGWEDARSCAFRGRAPTTLGGKPSTFATLWEDAAPCEAAPTQGNADADAFGRLWGKQGGVDCAFKFVGVAA
ncbi:hypothetical protein HT031_006015 [Scenedesmus sp. PABB004]|nr:hypothetical protein HT031_006015 [Scenedesmus sp. PABB004]